MSEQENLRIIQETYAAYQRGDIEALLSACTQDTRWIFPGPADVIPYAKQYDGREQLAQFFSTLNEAEEVTQFEPREFFAQGEKVVVLGVYGGRVRANGRNFKDEAWVHVFELRDGKVAGFREYMDTAQVAERFQATQAATAA